MHLPECHFKVAELKMHLRSPGAGRCESQGGVRGCAGDEDGGGLGGGRLVSSQWREWQLIRRDLSKWAFA